MEILAKIFGSDVRVKLMRIFLFNQDDAYTLSELSDRSRVPSAKVKKELLLLFSIGLIKKRPVSREVSMKKKKKIIVKKTHETGYILDQKFVYLQPMKTLLTVASLHADDTLVRRFASAGKIKLFIASGLFIQEWDTRVDLLIAGDELSLTKVDTIVKNIEAEVGREISYSAFETSDFEYRFGIHDRLVRDILDLPHVTLVDKLGIEEQA
ncbi:hypothetical protein EB052_01090 [bacterium]|nr:hypothetical protein [bacterium]